MNKKTNPAAYADRDDAAWREAAKLFTPRNIAMATEGPTVALASAFKAEHIVAVVLARAFATATHDEGQVEPETCDQFAIGTQKQKTWEHFIEALSRLTSLTDRQRRILEAADHVHDAFVAQHAAWRLCERNRTSEAEEQFGHAVHRVADLQFNLLKIIEEP